MSNIYEDPGELEDLEISALEDEYKEIEDQLVQLEQKSKDYQTTGMQAKERGDAETLSNTLIRLARVNSALGSRAAYVNYVARNAERAYRRTRERIKLDRINEKNAIGKAESMAYTDTDTERAFQIYSNLQLLADTASDLAYRTDTYLKMAQSGLSLIKNDIVGRP